MNKAELMNIDNFEKERIESEMNAEIFNLYKYLQKTFTDVPSDPNAVITKVVIDSATRRRIIDRIETSLKCMQSDMHLISYLDWRVSMLDGVKE